MVSKTTWTSILFVLQAALTATTLANATVGQAGIPRASNITSKSRKRQEIIFLRDDLAHKRNRAGETMANLEKHGKSLSAEGKVFKGAPKADNYEDLPTYKGPALKEQSVKKDNGPPEIKENVKKSDAYEVVSDGNDKSGSETVSAEEIDGEKVVKVGHPLATLHTSKGHHRSGLHIVSLDGDDENNNNEESLREKDLRLYGSIGEPSPTRARHKAHRHRAHHTFYQNDYIPPNVVSISQEDFSGPRGDAQDRDETFPSFRRPGFSSSEAQAREEIFPSLRRRRPFLNSDDQAREEMFTSMRRRDPFLFSQSSQLSQPEELAMQRFQPVSPKSISYGARPNMLLLPMYNGQADSNPPLVPMTAQSTFQTSPNQFSTAPAEFSSPPPTGVFRNGILFQPALQVPQIQTQSVAPSSYMMPLQSDGQILFNNQQPDVRSLYQLQSQPQMQIPQVPMPQLTQPQQTIIPTEIQMEPQSPSSEGQREMGPSSRWVDEDGRSRSEVLDREPDSQDDDRPNYDRNEEYDDEEARHQSDRYYDRDEDPREEENQDDRGREEQASDDRSYSREEEDHSEEEGEQSEEPEDEPSEDGTSRAYGPGEASRAYGQGDESRAYGPGEEEEQGPEDQPQEEEGGDDQEMEPPRGGFSQQGSPQQQFNPGAMPQAPMGPSRPNIVPKFPPQIDAQAFSRYQLTSPASALKEHILPEPHEEEPKRPVKTSHSDMEMSQMSPAEAQFLENKAAMAPGFSPPIASKDTIPGKGRRLRFGLENVLIRLNGKPLEDSSQLRSKIINGQIVQGKGKLIKSKGPVRVKLSHTKDSKHLKIIDILAPTKYHVYDTKSKIRRPLQNLVYVNYSNKTSTNISKRKPSIRSLLRRIRR